LNDAREVYLRVIKAAPDDPSTAPAYDGIAAVLQDQGHIDGAVAASRKAVELRRNPDAAYALGDQLERHGRADDAIEMFRLAAALRPGFAEAHARLGAIWVKQKKFDEAISNYRTAIDAKPDLAEAHCNLAHALHLSGDENSAVASAKRAIELKPELAEAHNVLGVLWKARRRPADALAEFIRAAQLRPHYAEACNNAGSVLELLGRPAEATRFYDNAITFQPDTVQFHVNLALNQLLLGNYPVGWAENEWRRREPNSPAGRMFPAPEWDGSPLNGRTIFLHAEQGMGDSVHFARYIPLVREHAGAGRIIVEVQPSLANLVCHGIRGVDEVVPQGQVPATLFDVHKPLLSLPLVFGTTVETIPNQPYLTPDPAKVAAWAAKLPPRDGKLRVGLTWSGNPRHKNDRNRSCPAAQLEPLGSVEGVSYISLRKGAAVQDPPASLRLIDLTEQLEDFADTAALMANLDMVVSVDTAVAHLAGAMGLRGWVMLPYVADWRWLIAREDSPWYPSLKLFRQTTAGDWTNVVERVRAALREYRAARK
jgi:tetratricopeptide (TPR) repeat protein